jgi:hypothetical protein
MVAPGDRGRNHKVERAAVAALYERRFFLESSLFVYASRCSFHRPCTAVLPAALDSGEHEAIHLALQVRGNLVIMDDRLP